MQNGEEDGAFDGKREVAIGEQLIENRAALGVAPQALEQQRRADAHAAEAEDAGLVDGGEDDRPLCQAGGGADEPVEVATAFDVFLASEIADDALLDAAVLADGLDQVDVGIGADALFTDRPWPQHSNVGRSVNIKSSVYC